MTSGSTTLSKLFFASVLILITVIFLKSEAAASEYAVPTAYASSPGPNVFLGPLANSPRVYQMLINESEITQLMNTQLLGITFRLPVSASDNWPLSDISFNDYDVYLSGSVHPSERSLTFAQNIVGAQKKVRSGSLQITANSFTSGGSPNAFGMMINFDSSYLYTSGHLLIEIRHTGFSGTSRSIDAVGTSVSGYGTLFSACWNGNYAGTSGTQGNFAVCNILYSPLIGINDPSQMPLTYSLKQNYPNPFNPVTKIAYDIPSLSKVELTVYDVSGKNITMPVNEIKNPGSYEIEFYAGNLTSGVYFYKIRTYSLIDAGKEYFMTRKMMVIK